MQATTLETLLNQWSSEGWEFEQVIHLREIAKDALIMVKPVVEEVNIRIDSRKPYIIDAKDKHEVIVEKDKPKAKRSPRSTKTSK